MDSIELASTCGAQSNLSKMSMKTGSVSGHYLTTKPNAAKVLFKKREASDDRGWKQEEMTRLTLRWAKTNKQKNLTCYDLGFQIGDSS